MDTTGDTTADDRRVQHRDQVRLWQQVQKANGRCRCGARIAEGSRSRCLECLERCRRTAAIDRGKPVGARRKRGRPMLGTLSVRRRLFEREEARRRRHEQRWGWRARFRWL